MNTNQNRQFSYIRDFILCVPAFGVPSGCNRRSRQDGSYKRDCFQSCRIESYKNKTKQLNFDWISVIVCTSTWGMDVRKKSLNNRSWLTKVKYRTGCRLIEPFLYSKGNVGSTRPLTYFRPFLLHTDRRKLSASVLLFFHECFSFFFKFWRVWFTETEYE